MSYKYDDYALEFRSRAQPYWNAAVAYVKGLGPAPTSPYQVEIHPSPVCPYRCVDCHGQMLPEDRRLPDENFGELVTDLLAMKVPSVILSGVCTDPGADPAVLLNILQRGGPQWGVRIHLNGHGLRLNVSKAIIRAAQSGPKDHSYITISRSAVFPEVLRQMCRPVGDLRRAWTREDNRIRDFLALAKQSGFPLTVRINLRLTKLNAQVDHLAAYLRWFQGTPEPVELRVTTDYTPVAADDEAQERFNRQVYLTEQEARAALDKAIDASSFTALNRMRFRAVQKCPTGVSSRCLFRYLFACVSSAGYVFPCPNLASLRFRSLAYGDLTQDCFPCVWSRYLEDQSPDPIALGCPNCAAECEVQLNRALEAEVNGTL